MLRREFIRNSAALALGYPLRGLAGLGATSQFTSDPFSAGVASGDPSPNGVVLWTRFMPDSNIGQEWQRRPVSIEWRIATDERLSRVVRRGTATARPEFGHSIHVDAQGLQPGRWYWYQFRTSNAESPIGRTKTAPQAGDRIRFAFASCQRFDQGYYTAYQNMVREDLDVVIFLGDYMYETSGGPVRPVPTVEPTTLAGYRERYAHYRSDPHLKEAHRLFPWIITWDDHEVDNNYAGRFPDDAQAPDVFLKRRADAYQAHYEWLPLPKASLPNGPNSRMHRRLSFGALANFFMLDERQHRSDQACGDGNKPLCAESLEPGRTMLGVQQEQWLERELRASRAQWNILGNQVRLAMVDRIAGPGEQFAMDTWAGYDAARTRFMTTLANTRVQNPIVITGDIHTNWINDLKIDYREERTPAIATEIVGTSISSGGDGADASRAVEAYLAENPHVKFYNGQRGYVRCEITSQRLTADFRVVEKVSVPESQISTRATFVVEDGRPGAHKV